MNAFYPLKIIFFFFFILINSPLLFAQTETSDAEKYCKQLRQKGKDAYINSDYLLSMKYYTKAENLAMNGQWKDNKEDLLWIKNAIATVYDKFSNYGEAIGYYEQAIDIATELKKPEFFAILYNNIGNLYKRKKDYKNALIYYNKSFDIINNDDKAALGVNIADLYLKTKKPKEAIKNLVEVKNLSMPKNIDQIWRANYAEGLYMLGDLDGAKKILEPLLKEINVEDDKIYVGAAIVQAKILESQNNIQAAIVLIKKALHSTKEMRYKIELYNDLFELYFKNKEYDQSKKFKDSLIVAKDSLSILINNDLFESNKVKLNIQEYQNELLVNQERQDAERKLYIVSVIFGFILFVFIYRGLRNKIIKQKQKEQLAINKQKIVDLELESVKNNLAEKNRKLSAKALYLSSRNELIEEIINGLSQMPQVTRNKEVFDYMKTLKSYLKTDEEWDEFISYFEEVNPEFLKRITLKHPDISTSDLRFICYVYMNLDTREIGNIFNITYNASRKRKIRIKEKMGIDSEDSLYDYLLKISNS